MAVSQTMMAEMREFGIDPMGSLRELGYEYVGGCLCHVQTHSPFAFESGDHYEALAKAVADYVPMLLEEEGGLLPLWLPLGMETSEARCPIFVSDGFEHAERLLLIIQGSGHVRAGIWGCSLCINDSLERGTILHYLRKAIEAGYGIVVFNPNENIVDGSRVPGSETFERHVTYVMENVVAELCSADAVDIIAHSHGGRALLEFFGRACFDSTAAALAEKLQRIVFTDSYHTAAQVEALPSNVFALLCDPVRAVNFVPHGSDVGTRVEQWLSQEYTFREVEKGCLCLSAGVLDHASTNYAAADKVFDFLGWDRISKLPGQIEEFVRKDSLKSLPSNSSSRSSRQSPSLKSNSSPLSRLDCDDAFDENNSNDIIINIDGNTNQKNSIWATNSLGSKKMNSSRRTSLRRWFVRNNSFSEARVVEFCHDVSIEKIIGCDGVEAGCAGSTASRTSWRQWVWMPRSSSLKRSSPNLPQRVKL